MISARAAIMQALVSGSGFGLELIGRVRAASGGVIVLCQGAAYPALRDLESEGLVRSFKGEPRQGRPRVHYELTAKGRKAALETRAVVLGLFKSEAEPLPPTRVRLDATGSDTDGWYALVLAEDGTVRRTAGVSRMSRNGALIYARSMARAKGWEIIGPQPPMRYRAKETP